MLPTLGDFRRDQLAVAALFSFLGFQYATWASRLPALKDRFDLGGTEVGLLLTAAGVGAAVSFPLVAPLMRRLGARRLALWSALVLVAVLPVLAAAGGYPLALLVIFVDGVAVGCLNVAMNAQGAALESHYGRAAMAQLHATFSGGSLGGALLASGVNTVTRSVTAHFAVAAVLGVLLLAGSRPRVLTDAPAPPAGERPAKDGRKGLKGLTGASRTALWLGCAMVFGTVVEGAMNDWSALYLTEETGASGRLAPLGIAVVSVMMVLARLLGDGWRGRWGDARMVRVGSTAAGAGLALALLTGGTWPALIGFACVGLGMATVTPCLSAVIGFVAGRTDLTTGMAVVAASAVLVAVCSWRVRFEEREAPGEAAPTAAAGGPG
ncbi:transporter [Streptomyces caelestis]|uniref:Transporter n=1 Tax=Streptomyces caelestis TaxID=36816 RepID=A0A0M8QMR2_9ACTN|nr:MFS transporter [Streptomyces caelestis]KOT40542.1 transporter [Streptomyces caelestis]